MPIFNQFRINWELYTKVLKAKAEMFGVNTCNSIRQYREMIEKLDSNSPVKSSDSSPESFPVPEPRKRKKKK
jgi:hypothetical protein